MIRQVPVYVHGWLVGVVGAPPCILLAHAIWHLALNTMV